MDYNLFLGAIQLAIAIFQLKLDHFSKASNRQEQNQLDSFYDLGEAIRLLEYALGETISFIGQTNQRAANPRLASLWENASQNIRKVQGGEDLADLTFEKNLYWRNPEFYEGREGNRIYRISLDNVLIQLRQLRSKYDKLQKKVNG